ncbi:MAG: hypothetical protein AB7H90_02930 [Alphaproteobacteria bacterium]
MALSELAICNRALAALGEEAVTSLTDNRAKAARLCNAAYPQVRDAVTRKLPWNCARRRARLAADAVPPAFGWSHGYTLPADFIRMFHIAAPGDTAYVIEGGKLLTNTAAPLDCIYIGRLSDPTAIDPVMAEIIAYALAAEIGRAIVQDDQAVVRVETRLASLWKEAEAANAAEHGFDELDPARYLQLSGLTAAEASICNQALVFLGVPPAAGAQELQKRAKLAIDAYPSARDTVLRRAPWNSARKRIRLSAAPTPPDFQWEAAYALPDDFIRMIEASPDSFAEWRIEGAMLLSDAGPKFDLLYIGRIDADAMDPLLAEAVALALAARIGPSLRPEDPHAINRVNRWLEDRIRVAMSTSAQEHSVREWDADLWLRARF